MINLLKKTSLKDQLLGLYILIGFILLLTVGIIVKASYLTIIYCFTTFGGAILVMLGRRYFVFLYIIQVLIYGYLAYLDQFYGETIINLLILFPLHTITMIGFYRKKKPVEENDINKPLVNQQVVKVNKLTKNMIIIIIIVIITVTIGYGIILDQIGSKLPYYNAFLSSICLSASFLTARCVKEQWYFWIVFSFLLMILWAFTLTDGFSNLPIIILVLLNFPINLMGLFRWIKAAKA